MTYFIAGLGAALGKYTVAEPGTPPGTQTFAQWLASTNSGAGPTRYWPMSDVPGATMTADTGGLNGTYINPGGLEFEIPDAAGVKHVGFDGASGHVTIDHPITTAAFTFMARIQPDAAATLQVLCSPDYVSTAGQFLIALTEDGAGGLKPRVGSKDAAGASVTLVGSGLASVPVGRLSYFFYLRVADGTQEVWVVDIENQTVTQVALTLDFGTIPGSWVAPPDALVRLGTVSTVNSVFDGVMNRVAMWGTAIPRADIQALADISPADEPIVVWAKALDAGDVNESTALADISILSNIHPSTGFTAAVVDGTGTHGTLTTDGTGLTYTAGAVTGNQTDTSMSWRISKGGVNSPTVGFSIDVLETGGAPPVSAQANCFDETGATLVTVTSMADLQTQVNNATGKKVVRIANGSYSGGTLTFTRAAGDGTQVIIRPLNNLGDVTINGGGWTFAPTSSWIVISKLYREGGTIYLQGSHNRISRCRFRNFGGSAIETASGGNQDCRIDHCEFSNSTGDFSSGINYRSSALWGTTSVRLLVDYCYFHDFTIGLVSNGFITSSAGMNAARGTTVTWDHCLIQNIFTSTTSEVVINKMGGMVYRFCTFNNCGDYFQWRIGGNCELRSSWFEATPRVMSFGKNNLMIGNRFIGSIDMWAPSGNVDFDEQLANFSPNDTGYAASENSSYIGNRFQSGHLLVGQWHSTNSFPEGGVDVPAQNSSLQANTRDDGGSAHTLITTQFSLSPAHTGTTISGSTSEPFDAAAKLTSSNVGLLAADPLCD